MFREMMKYVVQSLYSWYTSPYFLITVQGVFRENAERLLPSGGQLPCQCQYLSKADRASYFHRHLKGTLPFTTVPM